MSAISWKSGVTGDWSTASDWSTSTVPGAADAVTIAAPGTYAVTINASQAAQSLTLNNKTASVQDNSLLTLGGPLTLTAGNFLLNGGGTIKGGTIVMAGGSLIAAGGTLDGVTVKGVLALGSTGNTLTAKNTLTLTDAAGTGAGTLNITGAGAIFSVAQGSFNIDKATINLGSTSGDTFQTVGAPGTTSTATLGPLLNLNQTGQFATLSISPQVGDSLVNQGTLRAFRTGGTFSITGGKFVNQGTVTANNGDTLTIDTSSVDNSGTVFVLNASTLNVNTALSGTGTISMADSTVNLLGTVSASEINQISRAGGLVNLAGYLDNTGGTLNVGNGTGVGTVLLTGTIANGIIADGGLGMQFGTGYSPVLDGVTYQGVVDLSTTASRLNVRHGLNVTGAGGIGTGSINVTGNNSSLSLVGSQTLDNAVLRIGGGLYNTASLHVVNDGTPDTVTFGSGLQIRQASRSGSSASISVDSPGDTLVNKGGIFADVRNGSFGISAGTAFNNQGSIVVGNGDAMNINIATSPPGTFTNAGTLTVSNGGSLGISGSYGTATFVNGGMANVTNGSTLSITPSNFSNTGTLNVTNSTLNIGDRYSGNSWSSTGKINAINATVNLGGTITQTQLASITRSNGGVVDILGTLNNSGTLNIGSGAAFGTLTLAGAISGGTIRDTGGGLIYSSSGSPELLGVAYQGMLDLSQDNARVAVAGSFTLTGTAGTGAGIVNLTGSGSSLLFSDTRVLNLGTVNIGAKVVAGGSPAAAVLGATYSYNTTLLTIGAATKVQQVGALATLQAPSAATSSLINRGQISAGIANGNFVVVGNAFNNAGIINVSNGDTFNVQTSSFANVGTVNVTTGGTLALGAGGDWTSIGKINETNATVVLNGDVTLPELSSITRSGGTVVVAGTYDNTGGTLNVGTGSTLGSLLLIGSVVNGVVHDGGGGLKFAQAGSIYTSGGTLDAVTYQGTLDLSGANSKLNLLDNVTVTDVNGTGSGTIKLTGGGSILNLQGAQTLDNALLQIGGATNTAQLSSSGAVTLGSKLNVQQTGQLASLYAGSSFGDVSAGLTSQGTITAGIKNGALSVSGGNFANQGSISISNSDVLTIATDTFNNTGTVNVATGGVLNIGMLPSYVSSHTTFSNTGVIAETAGTINLNGTVTLANLNSITRSGGTVALKGIFDNASGPGTLNVGTGSQLGMLQLTGTIANATVQDAGNGIRFASSTALLDAVTYYGTLDLGTAGSSVSVTDGLTLAGMNNVGAANIRLLGANSALHMVGTQTLNNATLNFGAAGTVAAVLEASGIGGGTFSHTPPQLTLGNTVKVVHAGNTGSIVANGEFGPSGTIISQGIVTAALAGGNLTIGNAIVSYGSQTPSGSTFINQGSIGVSNGDTVNIAGTTFTNTGTVNVVTGGVLNIGQSPTFGAAPATSWSSTGTLSETNGTINLNGPVTLANLNSITRSGGTVALKGMFDNASGPGTLNVGTGSKLGTLQLTGTIANAVVHDAGKGIACSGNAALDNVTYQGTLDMSGASAQAQVLHQLTMTGASGTGLGTVILAGSGASLQMAGTQTLDNATINIGAAGFNAASITTTSTVGTSLNQPASQLTLGSAVTVNHTGTSAAIGQQFESSFMSGGDVISNGTINAGYSGGRFSIGGGSFTNNGIIAVGNHDTLSISADTFSNTGTVAVTGGGVLNLGQGGTWSSTGKISETDSTINLYGSLTLANLNALTRSGGIINLQGMMEGSGGTLNVGTGSALGTLQGLGGTIAHSTVHDTGGGLIFLRPLSGNGTTLDSVSYRGVLNLAPGQSSVVIKDGITLTGVDGTGIGLVNLTGAGSVLYADGTETLDNATINMGNNATFGSTIYQTDTASAGAVLTLGSNLTIDQQGNYAQILGARSQGDLIVNKGKILADVANGHFLITEGRFTNSGSIIVSNGDTFTIDPDVFTNTGSLVIGKASTMEVKGALIGGTVSFTSTQSGELVLGTPGSVSATIQGFGAVDATHSDTIDLVGKVGTKLSYVGNTSSGVLTVSDASDVTVATLTFSGNYTSGNFHLSSDGVGGTLISDPPVDQTTLGSPTMQLIYPTAVADASAGNVHLILSPAGQGAETIYGFSAASDLLDLRAAMADSGWQGDPSNIGSFVGTSLASNNTVLTVDPSGHGGGAPIAILTGMQTNLAALINQHAIIFN